MTQAGRIQAVVFDLDDTLYPERDYVASGYQAVCQHLHRTGLTALPSAGPLGDTLPPAANIASAVNRPAVASRTGGFAAPTNLLGPSECFGFLWLRFLAGESAGAFDALSEAFGLGLSKDQVQELVTVYREHRPRIEPYGGMAELLGRLHEGYRLGLLSDGYQPAQLLKLEALELARFFDVIVFTEDHGRAAWKPCEDCFRLIAGRLEAPPEACCYVADNPAKDFVAPNRMGWRTIQYLRPGQIKSTNEAPEGGWPQVVVGSPQALRDALRTQ